MVTRQRHTESEIETKLTMADEMAAQGVLHRDIAKSLGISLMTYHRWRKARGTLSRSTLPLTAADERTELPGESEKMRGIRDLRLENARLRRLVTDLLLEKVELEESLQGISTTRKMIKRN